MGLCTPALGLLPIDKEPAIWLNRYESGGVREQWRS